jgi:hypothetical protein
MRPVLELVAHPNCLLWEHRSEVFPVTPPIPRFYIPSACLLRFSNAGMLKISILRIRETHLDTSPYIFDDYGGSIAPVTITVCPVRHSVLPLLKFHLYLGANSWWRLVPPTSSLNSNKLYMGRRRCSRNHSCFHNDRCRG